ncbi:hypothetical protein TURU_022818 [Turdus rufiventris]|nr:hypothetical protein TURU_022818 [Turdus rufiventris]
MNLDNFPDNASIPLIPISRMKLIIEELQRTGVHCSILQKAGIQSLATFGKPEHYFNGRSDQISRRNLTMTDAISTEQFTIYYHRRSTEKAVNRLCQLNSWPPARWTACTSIPPNVLQGQKEPASNLPEEQLARSKSSDSSLIKEHISLVGGLFAGRCSGPVQQGQYCGEKYSGVFGNWEAEDECFILDFRNWFGITLQKVDWPGLPLSVFVNSHNRAKTEIPLLNTE